MKGTKMRSSVVAVVVVVGKRPRVGVSVGEKTRPASSGRCLREGHGREGEGENEACQTRKGLEGWGLEMDQEDLKRRKKDREVSEKTKRLHLFGTSLAVGSGCPEGLGDGVKKEKKNCCC